MTPQERSATVDRTPETVDEVLAAARGLAPAIAARAEEIEAGRRIPRDLLDELIAAGCFRVLLPGVVGGIGSDLPGAMRVFEALARADASVGWTVMIGASVWCDAVGLPRASFESLFAGGPDVIMAGAINPAGSMAAVAGGYRVTGRWGFASGCQHAGWLIGNCIEGVVDGVPQLRLAVFAADQVEIEDTWTVSGLCGTGSHHFRVDDLVVPAERTIPLLAAEPCIDDVIVRIPSPALISLEIASVAVGTALGALDDIVALATDKVPLFAAAPLATNPSFQLELANADTTMRAARTVLYETAGAAWETAASGMLSMEERARIRATAVWVTEAAAAVVTAAYRSGGGSSVYASSPLQRRLRDVNALTQHFLVKHDVLVTAGAVLAGQDVDVGIF
jgi:alkylation response protein AidB-like acyl-CoA dehydrogenase